MQSDDNQPRQNGESSHVEQTNGLYIVYCFLFPVKTFVAMAHFNCKATPTNDTDYSCYLKALDLV